LALAGPFGARNRQTPGLQPQLSGPAEASHAA
jgi:hypothetical protein